MSATITEAKERVLDVAEKLFMTRGYQSVSMRDIAQMLGVRQSSLYYHAPDGKEQLFFEAVQRSLHRHQLELEGILARYEPDFRAQLHAVAQWLMSLRDMDLMRVIRLDLPELSPHYMHRLTQTAYAALMQPLVTIIHRHQAAGNLRPVPAEALVGGVLAISTWTNYLYTTQPFELMPVEKRDVLIDVLLDGCWIGQRQTSDTSADT